MTARFAPLLAASLVSASVAPVACRGGGADNPVAVGQDSIHVPGDSSVVQVGKVRVVPDSAVAGDTVKLVFDLRVVPERTFTVTALIDGTPRVSQTRTEQFEGVFEIVLGEGADLIATFGTGFHGVVLDLRVTEPNKITVVQGTSFKLQ